jgi:hypothetical protein
MLTYENIRWAHHLLLEAHPTSLWVMLPCGLFLLVFIRGAFRR